MCEDESKTIHVADVPVWALDILKPYAERDGRSTTGASLVRYAVIELAEAFRDGLLPVNGSGKQESASAA